MKSITKITAIIFAIIMIASIIPIAVFADEVDPAKFFSAEKNTVTFLKDNDKIVLDMWLFKGDHSDVKDYKGLKAIKTGKDFIYAASLTKLETRDVPVRVDGSGTYTVVVRQKDGVVHSHSFELGFEHLLPTFAADAVTHIPADVRLIRYIEGDHSDMTMKELKAAGANVICYSYFTSESNGEKYYNFKKQCVGTWTFAVQYEDGNVKTVVVENEAIPEPAHIIEDYGITFDIISDATNGRFSMQMFSTDSSIVDKNASINIDIYDSVNRVYTDHLSYQIKDWNWEDYYDGKVVCYLDSELFANEVNIPKRSTYQMIITLTINGESESVTVKVQNPGIWAN